jgi:uncharacterized protein with ATP-grasp and redox domains
MKITGTCTDCLISRVRLECTLCNATEAKTAEAVAECTALLEKIRDEPLSHPQIASRIHRRAYEILGTSDPFAKLKREGNNQAIEVCKKVQGNLVTFKDHVLAAVIGNTFDYGVKGHVVAEDFSLFFEREFKKGLTIDDTDAILPLCTRVVYLSDNCGEIVLDRLLIKYLKSQGAHVTLAVKDAPALNDATLQDAWDLNLDFIVDCLTTTGGGAEIGICMANIPDDLKRAMRSCTIIIAKGMANFESLSEMNDLPPVAYLMAAKCGPVAEEAGGVEVGSKIAMLRLSK